MKGKVAIITGAGQGIGVATAHRMAAEGMRVIVSDVSAANAEAVVAAINDTGGDAKFVKADVSSVDDVKALIATAQDTYGGLHVLHNNAGVAETNFTETAKSFELDEAIWDKVMAINLKGAWMCSKYAAPVLAQSGGGVIINAGSIGGMFGTPMCSAYGPSKAALIQLTRNMALELAGQGTRVVAYAPGNTDTPLIQQYYSSAPPEERETMMKQLVGTHLFPRLIEPSEVANLIYFLASDEASAITGACIVVDHGTTAWRGVHE
jgi:NAD(P)-dependent dehydrogenase (short-subunit alcohol dehydrogenase family)